MKLSEACGQSTRRVIRQNRLPTAVSVCLSVALPVDAKRAIVNLVSIRLSVSLTAPLLILQSVCPLNSTVEITSSIYRSVVIIIV
jgi:hypothetical protein